MKTINRTSEELTQLEASLHFQVDHFHTGELGDCKVGITDGDTIVWLEVISGNQTANFEIEFHELLNKYRI